MSGDSRHQLPRLAIPGQTSVNVTHHPGTSIHHHPIVQQAPGALNVQLLGGLTKLEWVASHLLANNLEYFAGIQAETLNRLEVADTPEMQVCELAERLLSECHRRQHGTPPAPEGNGEE